MNPTTKSLIDLMREEPGSSWYDPGDKDTWFVDAALTISTSDPAQVRFLKNKVGPGSFFVGDSGLQSSDYGFYVDLSTIPDES